MPKHIRKKSKSNARGKGSMVIAARSGGKGNIKKASVVVDERVLPFLATAIKITQ